MSATPESLGPQGTNTESSRQEQQAGAASRAAPEEQRAAECLMHGRCEAETKGKKFHQRLKSNRAEPQNEAGKAARRQRSGGLEF